MGQSQAFPSPRQRWTAQRQTGGDQDEKVSPDEWSPAVSPRGAGCQGPPSWRSSSAPIADAEALPALADQDQILRNIPPALRGGMPIYIYILYIHNIHIHLHIRMYSHKYTCICLLTCMHIHVCMHIHINLYRTTYNYK